MEKDGEQLYNECKNFIDTMQMLDMDDALLDQISVSI